MPGPVSDSFDPEWGTSSKGDEIKSALDSMYEEVSEVLGNKSPVYIGDLIYYDHLDEEITATFTEQQWRILRFALERSKESL